MKCVIALGSNLGDSKSTLEAAIGSIRTIAEVTAVSSFYETKPVGGPKQPNYLNAVLIAKSELSPEKLLEELQKIENSAGRVRDVRWGARTLDLDLIAAGDIVQLDEFLTLPHPRAHERAFVLEPWLEIDPDGQLPGIGRIDAIFAALPPQE